MATASEGVQSQPQDTSPEDYELQNVHSVYASIAPHFSATRHKPWPHVSRFLLSLPPGSLGLDVGCGNGKYLAVNPSLHILASDRSAELLALAREPPIPVPEGAEKDGIDGDKNRLQSFKPAQLVTADTLSLPYRHSSADFIISIAVLHHLSTRQRRIDAIKEMLHCLDPRSPSSRCLLYVWALEQTASSRRAWNEKSEQDTLVPWVLRQKGVKESEQTTYQRYYHLYREGELEEDVVSAGGRVLESGYERDNWWVVCSTGS